MSIIERIDFSNVVQPPIEATQFSGALFLRQQTKNESLVSLRSGTPLRKKKEGLLSIEEIEKIIEENWPESK